MLSKRRNSLLRLPHALLMAVEDGKVVARVLTGAAGKTGYFALFDAENNRQAVKILMDEMLVWQKRQKADRLIGPIAPGEADFGGGVLVDGFDEPAAPDDIYNMPYYKELLKENGLEPFEERLVYRVLLKNVEREKYGRISTWAKNRFRYSVRNDLAKRPRELAGAICEIMEETGAEAMNRLVGTVCKELIPELCPVVFADNHPVGVLLTLGKGSGSARITMLWVKEAWRGRGVQAVLFDEALEAMDELGIQATEVSWIDSKNLASRLCVERAGGRVIRRYWLYEIKINEKITKK